jgi:thiol-disulfide isomerase/thioredoxin
MRNTFFILIFILVCSGSCKTVKPVSAVSQAVPVKQATSADIAPPAVNFSEQSTWLLGYFASDRLMSEPYSTWFLKGYDDYQSNSEAINRLLDINKDSLNIKIVMGTWCPDSRREVPRFVRILDIWKFPLSKVTFIGVDNAKLSPVGEYDKLNIQRVPTFIIYKNNNEAGRIIENPVTSLEQDMVNILTGNR